MFQFFNFGGKLKNLINAVPCPMGFTGLTRVKKGKNEIGFPHQGLRALLMWLIVFPVAGCDLRDGRADDVAIEIGSIRLTHDELKREMAFIYPALGGSGDQSAEVKKRLVRQVVDYYLIIEHARKQGIVVSDEEFQEELAALKREYRQHGFKEALLRAGVNPQSWKDRLRTQLLVKKVIQQVSAGTDPPSYEEMAAYFETHRLEFNETEGVRFQQIVCKSKKEAQEIRARLQAGERMSELANRYSVAPEAENRGDVAWTSRGELDESMEKALFSLKKGEISPVVKTAFGFHLLQVTERRPGGPRDLPEAIEEVESKLLRERQEAAYKKWLKNLRTEFKVKINKEITKKAKIS